ncbi:hypothetical protein YC2023_071726 [Brassica napus]
MFLFDCWLAGWPFISNPGYWTVDRSCSCLIVGRLVDLCLGRFGGVTDRPESLQLLVFNEEFLVSASHQLALTTSLPFVHTAHRSYRLNDPVKCSDRGDVGGSPSATSREVH